MSENWELHELRRDVTWMQDQIEKLEKDSHPHIPTVPYKTFEEVVNSFQAHLMDFERRMGAIEARLGLDGT